MNLKSIIACGAFLLGFGAATTSCEDMFTAENSRVTTDLAPKDTLYQVMGIVKSIQKLADRTVILGEVRADLVDIDPFHASADIQELAANRISTTNIYNTPADYYAVINNCNIYLAYVDSLRDAHGARLYYEKEICSVKCFRAWCYLELVKNYGEVPFITEPVITSEQAEEIVQLGDKKDLITILSFCINDLKAYSEMDYNNELRQVYGPEAIYSGIRFSSMFIPVRVLLGELYLWRASYTQSEDDYINAIGMYHGYFTYPNEEKNTFDYATAWEDRDFQLRPTVSYNSYFSSSDRDNAGVLPLDTTIYYGNVSDLRSIFNSQYANNYYPSLLPSQRIKDISKAQDYCLYANDGLTIDTIYGSHEANDYEDKLQEGDLRLYSVYNTSSNFHESQYNGNVSPIQYSISKYRGGGDADRLYYIPFYRHNILYLHMAEALNRADFPETAFAILKYGLSYYTMNNTDIISKDEFDRLSKIRSYGRNNPKIQETMYTDSVQRKRLEGTFVVWPSSVFGTYRKSQGGRVIDGGSSVQVGIHSLGSGDTEFNEKYWLDDEATLAGLKEHVVLPDTITLGKNPSVEDSIAWKNSIDAYNAAVLYNAEVDEYNIEHLASPEVRKKRKTRVSQLILEEEALEGMFEGLRFYDLMRYQMQEGKIPDAKATITLPDFIEQKYGSTPNMTGKPWYMTLPLR